MTSTIVAAEPTITLAIRSEEFLALLSENVELAEGIFRMLIATHKLSTGHTLIPGTLPAGLKAGDMRAVDRAMDGIGMHLLKRPQLRRAALAGDLIGNSLYYSAIPAATAAATWRRGLFLGALAGVGALALPERVGLGAPPDSGRPGNQLMTIAWYVIGGLATAAAANAYSRSRVAAAPAI